MYVIELLTNFGIFLYSKSKSNIIARFICQYFKTIRSNIIPECFPYKVSETLLQQLCTNLIEIFQKWFNKVAGLMNDIQSDCLKILIKTNHQHMSIAMSRFCPCLESHLLIDIN